MTIIFKDQKTGVELDKREELGLEIREQLLPDGYVEVDVFHPHTTPWDYCGGKHQREYCKALGSIEHLTLTTKSTILSPQGTGPGGRVRMGDNMCPGVYRIAVRVADQTAALQAFANHKEAIRQWLHESGVQPEACR